MSILQKYFKNFHFAVVIILILMAFLLFIPTLTFEFVFDDYPTILEYSHARISTWASMFFSSSRWLSRSLHKLGFMLSGLDPFGYRLVNMLLHASLGVIVYALFYKLLSRLAENWFLVRAQMLAFLAAALFLIHPSQTQVATYVSQMSTEGVAAFVAFSTILFFVLAANAKSFFYKTTLYFFAAAVAYCGAGSKEIIVVLPGLLFVTDYIFLAQGKSKIFLQRLAIHVLIAVSLFFGLDSVGVKFFRDVQVRPHTELVTNRGISVTQTPSKVIKPVMYRWTQPKVLLHYFFIFFMPFNLCFEYDVKITENPFAPDLVGAAMILLMLLAVAAVLFYRQQALPVTFGIAWFFAAMLPRVIVPSQELICDYKTYLASPGMMLLLSIMIIWAIEKLLQRVLKVNIDRGISVGVFVFLMGSFSMSFFRNTVWATEYTFWSDVVAKCPQRARAHNNLGVACLVRNNVEEAIKHFSDAATLDNTYGEPHVNLAYVYGKLGKDALAEKHYQAALESGEEHPQLFYNLALFNKKRGDFALARKALEHALKIRPHFPVARFELAKILFDFREYREAVKICEETFLIKAEGDLAFKSLYGAALFEDQQTDRALPFLLMDQENPRNAFMLGCCYFEKKDFAKARNFFDLVYRHNRHNVAVAYNFGRTLFQLGEYKDALEAFGRCNNVMKELPDVSLFKAQCLLKLGERKKSKELLTDFMKKPWSAPLRNDAERLLATI